MLIRAFTGQHESCVKMFNLTWVFNALSFCHQVHNRQRTLEYNGGRSGRLCSVIIWQSHSPTYWYECYVLCSTMCNSRNVEAFLLCQLYMHVFTCWCAFLPRVVQLQYIFFISNVRPLVQTTDKHVKEFNTIILWWTHSKGAD